jgi:hypothetical protein
MMELGLAGAVLLDDTELPIIRVPATSIFWLGTADTVCVDGLAHT